MPLEIGQAIFVKLPFADGGTPQYRRPFLIIDIVSNHIYALNVSSAEGKLNQLTNHSSVLINYHDPPFPKPSFVKVDALYIVEINKKLKQQIMSNGDKLREDELERIIDRYNSYKEENEFNHKRKEIDSSEFYKYN